MSKVRVLGGCLDKGDWEFNGFLGVNFLSKGGERLDFGNMLASVEQVNEEKLKTIAGTAGWGLAGAALLGPIGAIGGMLIGGNKKEITFVGYMKPGSRFDEGEKFLAVTDAKTFQKLLAITFK